MCAVKYMFCGMWVCFAGGAGERGSGFRRLCVGMKLG